MAVMPLFLHVRGAHKRGRGCMFMGRRVVDSRVLGCISPATIAMITFISPLAIPIINGCLLRKTMTEGNLHQAMTAFHRIDIEIEEGLLLEGFKTQWRKANSDWPTSALLG